MPKANVEIDRIEDIREHVLLRPDQYVGAIVPHTQEDFALVDGKIVKKQVTFTEGLLRILTEVISNAIDNAWRSASHDKKSSYIKLNIDPITGLTILRNDGLTIPVSKGTKKNTENIWQPSLVFGYFWTSSNYQDDSGAERKTSGRYGYGAKLTNALSQWLEVEVGDPDTHLQFNQRWEKNMSIASTPKTKSYKNKKGYTEVRFVPDFSRFGVEGYTPDILELIYRNMYDATLVTGVKCYINEHEIMVKGIRDYALCFSPTNTDEILIFKASDSISNSEVALLPLYPSAEFSLANGIITKKGGVHLTAWSTSIFGAIAELFSTKETVLSTKDVKEYFCLIVNSMVDKPKFSSQTKECLTEPKKIVINVPIKQIAKIAKWSVATEIQNLIENKGQKNLQKIGAKKGFRKIEGMDHANLSKGNTQHDCTMIVCEGASAKTFAVTGISKGIVSSSGILRQGRDYFGIYPVGGKILNVRNSSVAQLEKNKHIQAIIQGLRLQIGVDYTNDNNFKKLPYTQVLIIADPDEDGLHIQGLIINLFHKLFPTLMTRDKSFIQSMRTPLIRVSFKDNLPTLPFLKMDIFERWKNDPQNKAKVKQIKQIKYFKGLGSSIDIDVLETFGENIVEYMTDTCTDTSIVKAFDKDYADARKTWVTDFDPTVPIDIIDPLEQRSRMNLTDFIDKELIVFSVSNCERMIPSVMDGLKTSQRKILHTLYVLNLNANAISLKVNRLAGAVGKETAYHHGEECLYDTIVGMAQSFVGSNNMPLLLDDGQFGSRLSGNGSDAANARYIETKRSILADYILPKADLSILTYLQDDNISIEPMWFAPIIPLCLVNMCTGIGTGFSCNVPNYNPLDVIELVREWISHKRSKHTLRIKDIIPWYTGFTGRIEKLDDNKYITYGIVEEAGKYKRVIELPIGYATDAFKDYLDTIKEKREIIDFDIHCSKVHVDFKIKEETGVECTVKSLKLYTYLSVSNMVLYSPTGRIKHYTNIGEILNDFCEERYNCYTKRKNFNLKELRLSLSVTKNRIKFIEAVISDKIILFKRKHENVIEQLIENKITEHVEHKNFEYLLSMKVDSFTLEKIVQLKQLYDKLKQEYVEMKALTEYDIWLEELDALEKAYYTWLEKWHAHYKKLAHAMIPKTAIGKGATKPWQKKQ